MFQAVPKLKYEVARRQVFIQDEKHNVEDAVELEKIKGDVGIIVLSFCNFSGQKRC